MVTPAVFAALVAKRCPDHAVEILAAADEYAAWAIHWFAQPGAAVAVPAGRPGAAGEWEKARKLQRLCDALGDAG